MLASYGLDALAGDQELDRIARFAAHLCGAPSAAISLVDDERQRFLWSEGLDISETPRSTSFCAHTMLGTALLEVLDASNDPRFADFTLVRGDAHIRYYVGAPLVSSEGAPLGALCVTDTEPRHQGLDANQVEGLTVLAEAVKRRLEEHRRTSAATTELKQSKDRLQSMFDSVPDIAWSAAPDGTFDMFNARWTELTGLAPPKTVEDWRPAVHPDDFEPSVAKFGEAVSQATMFEYEWRMKLPDNSYRWMLTRAVPSSGDPENARWFGTITDIHDRYVISQERELLAGELAHRIKNIFSVITGLISLRARGDDKLKAFSNELGDTLRSLSRAQEFALPINKKPGDELLELLDILMAPYGAGANGAVSISGDVVKFGRRASTPLALVFHELATNSAKYGALSVAEGKLAIMVQRDGETARIEWSESNGPTIEQPQDEGFGSRLIHMAIEHQLGGSMVRNWQPGGLRVTIELPVERLSE